MSENSTTRRETCRVCGNRNLVPILSLGELYVSDFLGDQEGDKSFKAPLELILCNAKDGGCGLLQLRHTVSHEVMYRNYWYRSGMNKTMTDELCGIAAKVESLVKLSPGDSVIDIGANDGTLLRGYTRVGVRLIGYEPAKNLKQYNSVGTTRIFEDFFNAAAWRKAFGDAKAKAITAIAMFYDLEDPNQFVAEIAECLGDDGVFIVQQSYLPLMLKTNELGNICHEHLEYYSLLSIENLLSRHNLEVVDVELNDINGGSFRTYIRHKGKGEKVSIPIGADIRVAALREYEKKLGLGDKKVYEDFVSRVEKIKESVMSFLAKELARGKKVYVYGASTKGNTVLQYFKLDHSMIGAAAERNPDKWGKKTVGTMIPIISEAQARAEKPDYFLVLPWHFLREFREREKEFFARGGRFIVPFPEFRVLEG
jgi:NDP-4-keto-2,6-dideoxyhexose 3-C-methyltransferase